MERALALFILRSFNRLEQDVVAWCLNGPASDSELTALIESQSRYPSMGDTSDDDDSLLDAVDLALTENFLRGLGVYLLALETGEAELVTDSRMILTAGLETSQDLHLVPQWWCYRIAVHLLEDLWSSSFHNVLPSRPPGHASLSWQDLRSRYIAILLKRSVAEIELWPSQIESARRSIDLDDNLVVSLPTSAGKTRVAELCILRTLAENKRVVYVTPLRALSAQTEAHLANTFIPLGKTISTLYGTIGVTSLDQHLLHARDIIVATPEKLDFALRNDPTLIDDVGLVVLDEGHMIGTGEREIRYEVQVQRLLKRPDASNRRIVCLSAVLPEGDHFHDFLSWLRRDRDGTAVCSDWRPTRLRYGRLLWRNGSALLALEVESERPSVRNYITAKNPPPGRRKALFPNDQKELVLATAWRLMEEPEQSVLIYCPERRSVTLLADTIVDLHARGLLPSPVTCDPGDLHDVLSIGEEWLNRHHPILGCLRLGVAIHHGGLPQPLRKGIERLLAAGTLRITVSSPTLAQGLNLKATTVIFYSIYRREIPSLPRSSRMSLVVPDERSWTSRAWLCILSSTRPPNAAIPGSG